LTTKDYTYLLNRPYSLAERQTAELERILAEFPYLQSARAVYLKGLYNKDSFRYNSELKKTAAYTTDRTILFEFITTEDFRSVDQKQLEATEQAIAEITVREEAITTTLQQETTPVVHPVAPTESADKLELSIKKIIEESTPDTTATTLTPTIDEKPATEPITTVAPVDETAEVTEPEISPEENVSEKATERQPEIQEAVVTASEAQNEPIGSPLKFDQSETHSFAEWLQLSRLKPIDRSIEPEAETVSEIPVAAPEPEPVAEKETTPSPLNQKLNLIDRFIEASPKIKPVRSDNSAWENLGKKTIETPGIMTETLARVYLEQKKYAKAIQAYEILILKYPEKSVFFADRILDIKDLQQNNN
jgi:hypothetical protein